MSGSQPRVLLGIGFGLLAYFLFSTHDAANKFLASALPVWEVLFCRSLTIVIALLVVGKSDLVIRSIRTPQAWPLFWRTAGTIIAWLCYYTASRDLPLAQLMTLYFAAPIMVTLMAIPFLGERVSGTRWVALGMSFMGVCLASDPFGVALSTPTLLVLTAATLWATSTILMRRIARHEASNVQLMWQNAIILVVTGTACLFSWVPPAGVQWPLLLLIGIFGGLGQAVMFLAIRHTPAAVMSVVEYTGLIWAFSLGWIVWGDVPTLTTTLGALLIAASGVFLVLSERRRALARAAASG